MLSRSLTGTLTRGPLPARTNRHPRRETPSEEPAAPSSTRCLIRAPRLISPAARTLDPGSNVSDRGDESAGARLGMTPPHGHRAGTLDAWECDHLRDVPGMPSASCRPFRSAACLITGTAPCGRPAPSAGLRG